MSNQQRMILSIINNYTGYPFNRRKYVNVYLSDADLDELEKKINNDIYTPARDEADQIKEMYKIISKEIDDWEWETIMQHTREEYDEYINTI